MCVTPITIGNPTRRFVRGLSKPLLTVPCGHCKECVQKQQDDWFIRSVFESKRVQSKGGAVWFPTLTYNNEHLPWWIDEKHNFSCPCFDTDHIISFRNKLRVYLNREGFSCSGENTIRYMICCEYGGKRGRSHLHCLLYVPFDIPSRIMYKCLRKAWIYGFVMWSMKGMKAQGLQAAAYCMKYIAKEMSWYKDYNIDKYLALLHDEVYSAASDEERVPAMELLKAFRRATPGHRQSMGFGVDGLDYFKLSDGTYNIPSLVDGTIEASKVGLPPMKSGDSFKYSMPMYFARKIFYNLDEYDLYRMNDLGMQVFCFRFEINQKRKADMYSSYFNRSQFDQHLAPLNLPADELRAAYRKIEECIDGRFPSDLALFDSVYRDIAIGDGTEAKPFSDAVSSMSDRAALDFLRDNALDFMIAQKSIDRVPDPKNFKNRANKRVSPLTFNILHPFRNFTALLGYIQDYEQKLGLLENAAFEIQRLRQENIFGKDANYTSNLIFDL